MSIRSFKRAQARRIAREQRRSSALRRRGGLLAGAALSATTLFAASAQAATYTVSSTGDSTSTSACTGSSPTYQCTTLRDAVTAANSSPDTTNTVDLSGLSGAISLAAPLPTVGGNSLTLTGPGAGSLAVDGHNAYQILPISTSSPITITGLTLENGNVTGNGGAIDSTSTNGQLTLANDTVSGSTATGDGGGIYTRGGLSVTDSTITGNSAPTGFGGGLDVNGKYGSGSAVALKNTTISGNSASETGGAGLYTFRADIENSQVTGNTTTSTAQSGAGLVLEPKYGGTLQNSVISGNTAAGMGGGLVLPQFAGKYQPLTVKDTTISGNKALSGAGVLVPEDAGNIAFSGTTISGNSATDSSSYGGGLLLGGGVSGKFELADSTIAGNTAANGAGVSLGGAGYTTPLNQTYPGGPRGTVALDNSTIAGNTAAQHGGGIFLSQYQTSSSSPEYSGTPDLNSTIVAGNKDSSGGNDLYRVPTSTSGGFNGAFSLVQNPGNAPFVSQRSVILGKDPQLGALGNNGGATETMLPGPSSPVIDQGHSQPKLTADQRGDARTVDTWIPNAPGGDGTDIGAVELRANQVAPAPPSPTSGFSVAVRNTPLGSKGSDPLLVGSQTPVTCAVKSGTLESCVIEVRGAGKLLASGETSNPNGSSTLTVKVHPTTAGASYFKKHPLGVNTTVQAIGNPSLPGTKTMYGAAHLLGGPSITLRLPKRTARLSHRQRRDYAAVAKLLQGDKRTTCTAYSDKGKRDVKLTRHQAKAACLRIRKDGLKSTFHWIGRGHSHPIASNKTRKGRAANRRLVITFGF